jgi:hypothetical protein
MIRGASQSDAADRQSDLAATLFGDLDADGSGGISLEESGLDKEIYSGLDADQDGNVTLAELGNALELQRAAFMTQMTLYGQDGSQPPSSDAGATIPNAQDSLSFLFGGQTVTSGNGSLSEYLQASANSDTDDMVWSAFAETAEDTTTAESAEDASASASVSGGGGGSEEEEYDEMDINRDGVVSPEEYAVAMAKREATMSLGSLGETGTTGRRTKAAGAYSAFTGMSASGAGAQGLNITT